MIEGIAVDDDRWVDQGAEVREGIVVDTEAGKSVEYLTWKVVVVKESGADTSVEHLIWEEVEA